MSKIKISLAANEQFLLGLVVSIRSIVLNCSEKGHFLIFDGGLKKASLKKLDKVIQSTGWTHQIVAPDLQRFDGLIPLNGNYLTYCRLLLPEIEKTSTHIIYADCDILYQRDFAELWDMRNTVTTFAACRDPIMRKLGDDCRWLDPDSDPYHQNYYNCGVVLMNLEKMRYDDFTNISLAQARKNPSRYRGWDQSILNLHYGDTAVELDSRWNHVLFRDNDFDLGKRDTKGVNLHFIFKNKPWLRYSMRKTRQLWRNFYSQHISVFPTYMLSFNFWAGFIWADLLKPTPIGNFLSKLISRI